MTDPKTMQRLADKAVQLESEAPGGEPMAGPPPPSNRFRSLRLEHEIDLAKERVVQAAREMGAAPASDPDDAWMELHASVAALDKLEEEMEELRR